MKDNEASSTAYTVVHGILHTAKNPDFAYLVDKDTINACNKILSSTPNGRKRLLELNSPLKSKILPFLEWLLVPGITLNYVLRKKFIEQKVLEAIENGTTQIINIGAGFDTLAWRLSEKFPTLTFIEIDHPATSKEKIKALGSEIEDFSNLHFISADLSKVSLEDTLKGYEGFDPTLKTLFISEGVLMYLDEKDVIGVFDSLKKLTGEGTVFIFSCMEPPISQKNNIRKLLHLYLKIKNESYRWYKKDVELSNFLDKRKYSLVEMADSKIYLEEYLKNRYKGTLHKGEYIAVAKVI